MNNAAISSSSLPLLLPLQLELQELPSGDCHQRKSRNRTRRSCFPNPSKSWQSSSSLTVVASTAGTDLNSSAETSYCGINTTSSDANDTILSSSTATVTTEELNTTTNTTTDLDLNTTCGSSYRCCNRPATTGNKAQPLQTYFVVVVLSLDFFVHSGGASCTNCRHRHHCLLLELETNNSTSSCLTVATSSNISSAVPVFVVVLVIFVAGACNPDLSTTMRRGTSKAKYQLTTTHAPLSTYSVLSVPLLLLVLTSTKATADSAYRECNEQNNVFDETVQNCCRVCPAGYGVALPCTENNDTICTKCALNHYSAFPSHKDSCETCSLCPKNAKVVHYCNATHNTKCECEKNFFKDAHRNECRACKGCSHGEGVVRQCDPYHDTLCKSCPPQYFSNSYSTVDACRPCSKCKPGETVRKECTSIEDTVCEGSGYVSARNLSGPGQLGSANAEVDDSAQKNIIPIYCALLGAVIVILIIYVVVKRFHLCSCGGSKTHQPPKTAPALMKPVHPPGVTVPLKTPNRKCPSLSSASSELKPILVTNETLVQDLPGGLRREIEKRLVQTQDEKKNWVALAQHFEYSPTKIRGFEFQTSPSRPASTSSQQAAARLFLADWAQRSRGTVQALIDALRAIKRDDVAIYLVELSNSRSTWTPIDIV